MSTKNSSPPHLDWLNPIKAFALLAILLNHLVEEFGRGPWFTNPSENWPDLAARLSNIYPSNYSFPFSMIQFLGWLGDSAPGVFIFISGFGLTWSYLHKRVNEINTLDFHKRRLSRIFPLYIAAHFVIFAGALVLSQADIKISNLYSLFSLIGVRFTDSLFFYINPSWWFVWLILQLYLIFPFLFALLKRIGLNNFILYTALFTFLSRLLGILGVRFSESLSYWMTGIFFGTRLIEFTFGMVAAVWLLKKLSNDEKMPSALPIFLCSLFTYVFGIIVSFTLLGSIIANLLVTLGMTGIFYFIWVRLFRKITLLSAILVWIGTESYGVYLIHQTPLKWSAAFFPGNSFQHILAALTILIISFPVAWTLTRAVNYCQNFVCEKKNDKLIKRGVFAATVLTIAVLLTIEPRLWEKTYKADIFYFLLGCAFLIFCTVEIVSSEERNLFNRFVNWSVSFGCFLQLFVLQVRLGRIAVLCGILFSFFALSATRYVNSRFIAWPVALTALMLTVAILEISVRYYAPLEAGQWGEFPALEAHHTRGYALKPNQRTHLKYNNYDYIIKTNNLGLNSPEITVQRPTSNTLRILVIGDAFSMPEGMPYEDAFPYLMEKKLSNCIAPRKLQVINAGVTGYGPAEQYPQLQEIATTLLPNIVVYEFFINEFIEASISKKERLRNIGLISKEESKTNLILNASHLVANLELFNEWINEKITGDPASWRYGKALLKYYEVENDQIYSTMQLEKVYFYLRGMHNICKRIGAHFIIYFVPGAAAVSSQSDITYFPWDRDLTDYAKYDLGRPLGFLTAITDELDIPVVDLTPFLRKHPAQPVYFPKSWHWNKKGHRIVADVIADDLLHRDLLGTKYCRN